MRRRDVLKLSATAAAAYALDGWADEIAAVQPKTSPIIDCHIHMFDTARPGGVPWPEKSDAAIYKPSLPDRYARIARPLGVVGAIAVEASPLESDNDWVLKQAADHPIIVGFVGDLIPGTATYLKDLDALHANPIFVGIRYGNLWQRDLSVAIKKVAFLSDLKKLSSRGLELDTANPDPRLIRAILDVSDTIPDLRIVIDHLPAAPVPTEISARKEYWANLNRLSRNPKVFIKLSEIPVRKDNVVRKDVAFYQEKLDAIWDVFGEDHILYGSDWPNSDHLATYAETLRLVRNYISQKGREASQKFFWKNSLVAYQWHARQANQHLP